MVTFMRYALMDTMREKGMYQPLKVERLDPCDRKICLTIKQVVCTQAPYPMTTEHERPAELSAALTVTAASGPSQLPLVRLSRKFDDPQAILFGFDAN